MPAYILCTALPNCYEPMSGKLVSVSLLLLMPLSALPLSPCTLAGQPRACLAPCAVTYLLANLPLCKVWDTDVGLLMGALMTGSAIMCSLTSLRTCSRVSMQNGTKDLSLRAFEEAGRRSHVHVALNCYVRGSSRGDFH